MKINKFLVLLIVMLSVIFAILFAIAIKNKGDISVSGEGSGAPVTGTGSEEIENSYDPSLGTDLPDEVSIVKAYVCNLETVDAGWFVSAPEGIKYSVEFAKAPDTGVLGEQNVILRIYYNGQIFQRYATAYVFHMVSSKVYELSSTGKADIRDFVSDPAAGAYFAAGDEKDLDLSRAGERTAAVVVDGREYAVTIDVKDTVAPTAVIRDLTLSPGSAVEASAFIVSADDLSGTSYSYEREPDWKYIGDQQVKLLVSDRFGNTSVYTALLHIAETTDGPTFTGLDELRICVGDTISYRSGVKCADSTGAALTFTIDASAVDRNRQGTYYAVYSAVDGAGRSAQQKRKITVYEVTKELVDSLCDNILASIISDSYSRDDKIKAVWRWSKNNITYTGSSVSYDNELRVAYAAFDARTGDCYTYFIANKYLLNRLGIENIDVARVKSVTRHWWNLVKFSNGKWYHIDSCPHPKQLERSTYKMTESDLLWFTEQFKSSRHPNYYEYDTSLPVYSGIDIAE